jgi:hypothetical protein
LGVCLARGLKRPEFGQQAGEAVGGNALHRLGQRSAVHNSTCLSVARGMRASRTERMEGGWMHRAPDSGCGGTPHGGGPSSPVPPPPPLLRETGGELPVAAEASLGGLQLEAVEEQGGPASRSFGGAGPPRGAPAARVCLRGTARSMVRVGPARMPSLLHPTQTPALFGVD